MKNIIMLAVFAAAALTLGACKHKCCKKACPTAPAAACYGK